MPRTPLTPNAVTKTITLPRQVCDEIAKLAEQNRRTFSNQVSVMLEKQVATEALSELKDALKGANS